MSNYSRPYLKVSELGHTLCRAHTETSTSQPPVLFLKEIPFFFFWKSLFIVPDYLCCLQIGMVQIVFKLWSNVNSLFLFTFFRSPQEKKAITIDVMIPHANQSFLMIPGWDENKRNVTIINPAIYWIMLARCLIWELTLNHKGLQIIKKQLPS